MVGATGFEPATSCSQSKCSTRLSYAPTRRPPLSQNPGAAQRHFWYLRGIFIGPTNYVKTIQKQFDSSGGIWYLKQARLGIYAYPYSRIALGGGENSCFRMSIWRVSGGFFPRRFRTARRLDSTFPNLRSL